MWEFVTQRQLSLLIAHSAKIFFCEIRTSFENFGACDNTFCLDAALTALTHTQHSHSRCCSSWKEKASCVLFALRFGVGLTVEVSVSRARSPRRRRSLLALSGWKFWNVPTRLKRWSLVFRATLPHRFFGANDVQVQLLRRCLSGCYVIGWQSVLASDSRSGKMFRSRGKSFLLVAAVARRLLSNRFSDWRRFLASHYQLRISFTHNVFLGFSSVWCVLSWAFFAICKPSSDFQSSGSEPNTPKQFFCTSSAAVCWKWRNTF